MPRQASRKSLI